MMATSTRFHFLTASSRPGGQLFRFRGCNSQFRPCAELSFLRISRCETRHW